MPAANQSKKNVATILNMIIGKVANKSLPQIQIYICSISSANDTELPRSCVVYPTYRDKCGEVLSGFRHSNVCSCLCFVLFLRVLSNLI